MRTLTSRTIRLFDLLVLAVLMALLVGAVVPGVSRMASAASDRKECFDHLRQIGQALMNYANENKGSFPRTIFTPGASPTPTAYTNPLAPHSFQPGGPAPNDVSAALFLLQRTQDIPSKSFICSAAPVGEPWDFGGKRPNELSNFPGRQYLSYSYANPYPSHAAIQAGFRMNRSLGADFAVAADMNSGSRTLSGVRPAATQLRMREANSRSHDGEGQNVLYADGHVEFQNTVFCGAMRTGGAGVERDNIYAAVPERGHPVRVNAPPQDAQDSVLLPTFLDGPATSPGAVQRAPSRAASPRPAPLPPAAAPSARRAPVGDVRIRQHQVHVTQYSAPPWVWVLAFGGAFVLIAGMAVFVIVVARSATRAAPAPSQAPRPPPLPPRELQK